MNIRRLLAFIVVLPCWPLIMVGAMIDDEAEVREVLNSLRHSFRRIHEE